jgi:hypothetical protein
MGGAPSHAATYAPVPKAIGERVACGSCRNRSIVNRNHISRIQYGSSPTGSEQEIPLAISGKFDLFPESSARATYWLHAKMAIVRNVTRVPGNQNVEGNLWVVGRDQFVKLIEQFPGVPLSACNPLAKELSIYAYRFHKQRFSPGITVLFASCLGLLSLFSWGDDRKRGAGYSQLRGDLRPVAQAANESACWQFVRYDDFVSRVQMKMIEP